jgi:FkbH-like protein
MDSLNLPWLVPAAADFQASVRGLRQSPLLDTQAFRRLSSTSLNLQQLTALARALPRERRDWPKECLPLRVLSNATTDLLLPALSATAPRHALWLAASAPAFGTYAQEALDPQSATHIERDGAILLALDHRSFDLQPSLGQADLANSRVDLALDSLLGMASSLQQSHGRLVILQTLAAVPEPLFGNMDGQIPGTLNWMIDRFNAGLRQRTGPGQLLLDVAQLAATVGLDRWHDASLWSLGKIAFSQRVVPLYADHVCRLLAAALGKSKKCLVLDLDNTLWGGVIGDDGLAGIVLGQGSPKGEAHLAVQATALALRHRGIVLAVSSKNDDTIARQPFREHPEMLLREEHIAAFQANWQDKASNLRAIAQTLNIGLDALVLLDDNPAERLQVREALPEVGVPELPAEPELYVRTLLAAGYFESVQFTVEDRERAAQYQANAARSAILGSATDLQSHLASLQMEAYMAPFDELGRARITQLINKTNQFNLCTHRRSEAEVAALQAMPDALTMQVRLTDRFGDNGIIAVVVGLPDGDAWLLDSWLMSCRVLNRGVERAMLNVIVARARARGVKRLVGHYLPTEKNALVRGHYAQLGFTELPMASTSGSTAWALEVDSFADLATHIRIAGPWSNGL